MEEVSLTETENRYYGDLFLLCDEEKTGKIPMFKASELYRSANLSNEKILEITSLAGIPDTAIHVSRAQFYSCLKLIAAHQASMPLKQELIVASVQLPLPRFSWTEIANKMDMITHPHNAIPPPPVTDRRNSLQRRSEWSENNAVGSRRNSSSTHQHQPELSAVNSDVPSTDSEVEQCESSCGGEDGVSGGAAHSKHHRRGGSPEAWSTNSDSPTPTNSVAERPWAKDTLWHGLLGDEHRQLLGTEEESSDRHSSDDENETDLETVYQITPEQREYYFKQFKAVQHDPNGLLSGHVARVFFEKSRIPVEELRHIWQLCDVTRDGALSLAEFTAAMHLVVLRRNNIPLPASLPVCLHPNVLQHTTLGTNQLPSQGDPPEADLLHLDDDDEEDNTDNTVIGVNATITAGAAVGIVGNSARVMTDKNVMNLSTHSTSSQASISSRQGVNTLTTNPQSFKPSSSIPPPPKLRNINSPKADDPTVTGSPLLWTSITPDPREKVGYNTSNDNTMWTTTDYLKNRSISNSPKAADPTENPPSFLASISSRQGVNTLTTNTQSFKPSSSSIPPPPKLRNMNSPKTDDPTGSGSPLIWENVGYNTSKDCTQLTATDYLNWKNRSISNSPKAADPTETTPSFLASISSRQGVNALATNPQSFKPSPIPPPKLRSVNSPTVTLPQLIWDAQPIQWTKFNESPTSNVSSPGPKPVNFDMQRTAQAVVSDPQILHPVPLRVTPVAGGSVINSTGTATTEKHNNDSGDGAVTIRESSPKSSSLSSSNSHGSSSASGNASGGCSTNQPHRDSLQNNDLRAIQRPQAKKLPIKNIGALPPPPQREYSTGLGNSNTIGDHELVGGVLNNLSVSMLVNKKDPPPLPPPRPHRHGRSSSLDLNKYKIGAPSCPQPEIMTQASFDLQTSSGFADFTHFPDGNNATDIHDSATNQQQMHSLPPQSITGRNIQAASGALPPTRLSLQSNQHVSAFEVYRKPNTPRNSQSPTPLPASAIGAPPLAPAPTPFGSVGATAMTTATTTTVLPNSELYEKRVNAISETLRHVSFKQEHNNNTMTDVLRHLREQNNLLLHLCNDLSDELLTVQTRKEEIKLKLENSSAAASSLPTNANNEVAMSNATASTAIIAAPVQGGGVVRTGSSISAPVTANITGGSASSGVHSNV